jgi:hypothetical protein
VAFANTVTTQQTKNLARLKIWRAVMPGTALGVLLEVLTKDDKLPVLNVALEFFLPVDELFFLFHLLSGNSANPAGAPS